MIGRLVRSVDFERVLRTPSRARTIHFALHHLADRPSIRARPAPAPAGDELSTAGAPEKSALVDDSLSSGPGTLWLGAVVPKRHARRSVTRSLLKRQIRVCVADRSDALEGGLWVVRLRAPFDRQRFPSAASCALKAAARRELQLLLADAARRVDRR